MSLLQKSVLNKYLNTLDSAEVDKAYLNFNQFYGDEERIENIKLLKEENYQEGFLREIFVDVLGYTINPNKNYNLTTEFKNETDSKKADGAILLDSKAIGVIELKSTKTTDMESIIDQAFNYKNHQTGCKYVITSNFEKLRFYIDNATEFEEFYLFDMDLERFKIFYLLLSKENIFNNIPAKIKKESQLHEEDISDKLYKDYSEFKYKIYRNLIKNNTQYNKLILFQKSQKLLDRILFILFAEDSGLVPPNAISEIIDQWKTLIELDEKKSLYSRFVKFFHHLDVGHKYTKFELPAYNGGLFKKDDVLDNVFIDDEVLLEDALKLSGYDYSTEVDVNILGHIFEHSISEIEEITAELEGTEKDTSKSKRKKEGVFYTPKYITKYIVENTIGELCNAKKKELNLDEIDEEILENSRTAKGKLTKKAETLFNNLQSYREYILSLKILDPACGSGAFLNQALDFLIEEHKWIDEQRSRLLKESLLIVEYQKNILEQNLYGVDINEEAVEIAKLSLWLRTARKGRKLSDLSKNIKCGNSLIDNPEVAGDKAFNWENEFPDIMKNGGFDVVIGNPPYVSAKHIKQYSEFFLLNYKSHDNGADLYCYFYEKALSLLKELGEMGFISSNKFFRANYGKGLRSVLNKNQIRKILDFGELPIFQDASTFPAIILIRKIKLNAKIEYFQITKEFLENFPTKIDELKISLEKEAVVNDYWSFLNKPSNELLEKIQLNKTNIGQFSKGRIRRGILTGFNEAFIIDGKKKNELIKEDRNSTDLIKPFVAGNDVRKYLIDFKDKFLILTKIGVDIEKYPAIFNHLKNYQEKLEIRQDQGNYWWELRACDYYEEFHKPRIIYGQFLKSNYFTPTDEEIYFGSNHYMLVLNEYKTALGVSVILNSKLFFWYMSQLAGVLGDANKGGRLIMQKSHFVKFPLPQKINNEINRMTKLAEIETSMNKEINLLKKRWLNRISNNLGLQELSTKITEFYNHDFKTFLDELKKKKVTLTLKEQDEWEEYFNEHKQKILELQYQIDQTDREIDQLVYQLYGLTEEEIKIVEESTK